MRTELGCTVRDKITGLKGVVVAVTDYLTGCTHVSIQPIELKDGRPQEWVSLNINQVEVMKDKRLELDDALDVPGQRRSISGPQPKVDRW